MFSYPILVILFIAVLLLIALSLGIRFLAEGVNWLFPGAIGNRRPGNRFACPNPQCRHPNLLAARFCAQCGQAIRKGYRTN